MAVLSEEPSAAVVSFGSTVGGSSRHSPARDVRGLSSHHVTRRRARGRHRNLQAAGEGLGVDAETRARRPGYAPPQFVEVTDRAWVLAS